MKKKKDCHRGTVWFLFLIYSFLTDGEGAMCSDGQTIRGEARHLRMSYYLNCYLSVTHCDHDVTHTTTNAHICLLLREDR